MPSKLNAISTGTPSLKFTAAGDGALEIQNDGNTAITISNTGIATFAQPPLTAVPAFRVWLSTASVALTNNVLAVVPNNIVDFDTNSYWDASNYRYTPQIPGYYHFFFNANVAGSAMTGFYNGIRKNGDNNIVGHIRIVNPAGNISTYRLHGTELVYMNGTTDYVDQWVIGQGTSPTVNGGQNITYFGGFLVRAT